MSWFPEIRYFQLLSAAGPPENHGLDQFCFAVGERVDGRRPARSAGWATQLMGLVTVDVING
jgi:hypothetical protein